MPATTSSTMNAVRFDPRNLEIKTKSIEQTLVPLVSQVSILKHFILSFFGFLLSLFSVRVNESITILLDTEIGIF